MTGAEAKLPELPEDFRARVRAGCKLSGVDPEKLTRSVLARIKREGDPIDPLHLTAALSVEVKSRRIGAAFGDVLSTAGHQPAPACAPGERVLKVSEGEEIVAGPTGVYLRRRRILGGQEVWTKEKVISGTYEPRALVEVEGHVYSTVSYGPNDTKTAFAQEHVQRLRKEGRLWSRQQAEDTNAKLLDLTCGTPAHGFPTFGAYQRPDGRIELCLDPVPVTDDQRVAWDRIRESIAYAPTSDDWRAYREFAALYELDEVLPFMGLAAVAPFAHLLRGLRVFVPHAYAWSREHALGKTTVAMAFSTGLFGYPLQSGDSLDTRFRFSSVLDSASVAMAFNEAERIHLDKIGDLLKHSAEAVELTARGKEELSKVYNRSRGVLFLTGNALAIKSGSALARFLVSRFHGERVSDRQDPKRKLAADVVYDKLRPCGASLARMLLRDYSTADALRDRVRLLEGEIAEKMQAAQPDAIRDSRRPQQWAVVRLGLEAWKSGFDSVGVDWELPNLSSFVASVVLPVEEATFESEISALDRFRSFFAGYRTDRIVRKTVVDGRDGRPLTSESEARGKGATWEPGEFMLEELRPPLPGYWVTTTVLDEYSKGAQPDLRIETLKDLQRDVANERHLPLSAFLEPGGRYVRRHDFSDGSRARAAFVTEDSP